MLCTSFFTPGRDIGSAVFMVWVLKSLGTDKTGVVPMRSDGQITADTKQKFNITNSVSTYSPWNHKTTSPTAPKPTP
jgi:hypothetical protein